MKYSNITASGYRIVDTNKKFFADFEVSENLERTLFNAAELIGESGVEKMMVKADLPAIVFKDEAGEPIEVKDAMLEVTRFDVCLTARIGDDEWVKSEQIPLWKIFSAAYL